MKSLHRAWIAGLLSTLLLGLAQAQAPAYPNKPLRIVVPYAPGGPADVMVRAIGQQMGESWGQPFVVDNKPGANEIIAADFVAKSPADGYTFLVASDGAYSLNQHLYPKIPYDPVKDFEPVAKLAVGQLMLVTRPDFPASNVQEFIDYVKRNPGKLNYASIGAGGVNHLASAWFNNINGLQMEHVAFKGLPAAVQELMAGRIDVMFSVTGGVAPFIESGKVKGLAVSGQHRQPAAPKVPTFAEVGFPNFEASYYFGVMAPRGTPPDLVKRLHDAFKQAMEQPTYLDALKRYDMVPIYMSSADYRKFAEDTFVREKALIEKMGLAKAK